MTDEVVIRTWYGGIFDETAGKSTDVLCQRRDEGWWRKGKNFKMGFEDWDIIGQGTASLSTITTVVKKAEGDKYVTNLVI